MNLEKQEPFDPRQYFRVINKRKSLLILPFLGVVFTVMLGSFFIAPGYQSTTTILVAEPQLLSLNMERLAASSSRERIDTLRREITSRDYLSRLIRTLEWDADPVLRQEAEQEREKYLNLTAEEIVERWLIGSLRKRIRVEGQGLDLLTITVEDREPKTALLLAKTLAQVFIDETLRRELSGVRGALEFSNEQLAIYEKQLEDSEEKLRSFRERMVWQNLKRDVKDEANLERINSLASAAQSDLRQAEQSVTSFTIRLQNLETGESIDISDPQVAELKQEYYAQASRLADQLIKYTWRDARVISLSEEINERRESIASAVARACRRSSTGDNPVYCQLLQDLELARADVTFYRSKWESLRDYVDNYERSLVQGPQEEMTLDRLKEEVESNRKLYQMFLDQSHGHQIQEAAHRTAAEGRFRIMEPAMLPLNPVKPNRFRLALLGCVMGAMLGLALVFMVEYLDHSLSTVEEVERYLGLPVLGTIPRMDLGIKRGKKTRVAMIVALSMLMALLLAIFVKQRLLGV
jgi:polysaccharide chain length determinant protein (PEP-CTERM system associated)